MDDEIDIELRSAAEVALRAIIVGAVLQRIALEDVTTRDELDVAGEAFDLREWIVTERLSSGLTTSEARIFETPVGDIPYEDCVDLSWQSEALDALLWSIGARELPSFGVESDLTALLDAVPSPWDRVGVWVQHARLRLEPDIACERELADLWYWRLGAEVE